MRLMTNFHQYWKRGSDISYKFYNIWGATYNYDITTTHKNTTNIWNLFKVNDKTPQRHQETLFCILTIHCEHTLTHLSSVENIEFEQEFVSWAKLSQKNPFPQWRSKWAKWTIKKLKQHPWGIFWSLSCWIWIIKARVPIALLTLNEFKQISDFYDLRFSDDFRGNRS